MLKMPRSSIPIRKAVRDLVKGLLEEFGLSEVADIYVGGLRVCLVERGVLQRARS